jgi:hypothetical protein
VGLSIATETAIAPSEKLVLATGDTYKNPAIAFGADANATRLEPRGVGTPRGATPHVSQGIQ